MILSSSRAFQKKSTANHIITNVQDGLLQCSYPSTLPIGVYHYAAPIGR